MTTAILIIVLIAVIAAAAWKTYQKLHKGSGCCGEHEAAEKKKAAADRNKSHYKYSTDLEIGGMTCSNCARKVENALNELPGTWAKVNAAEGTARVRTKEAADMKQLKEAVRKAGYVVL